MAAELCMSHSAMAPAKACTLYIEFYIHLFLMLLSLLPDVDFQVVSTQNLITHVNKNPDWNA